MCLLASLLPAALEEDSGQAEGRAQPGTLSLYAPASSPQVWQGTTTALHMLVTVFKVQTLGKAAMSQLPLCAVLPSQQGYIKRYYEVPSHGTPLFLVVTPVAMHLACKRAKCTHAPAAQHCQSSSASSIPEAKLFQ